jgi:hypothetical protein
MGHPSAVSERRSFMRRKPMQPKTLARGYFALSTLFHK